MCISSFFTEGAGLAHEYAAVLAQGPVGGFDTARDLGVVAVLPARQDAHAGRTQVGETPAIPPVAAGQRLPQVPGRGRAGPAPRPRCAGGLARRPAGASAYAVAGSQTFTSH